MDFIFKQRSQKNRSLLEKGYRIVTNSSDEVG